LRQNDVLKRIMTLVLALGNRLNASSAKGFRLDTLLKVKIKIKK